MTLNLRLSSQPHHALFADPDGVQERVLLLSPHNLRPLLHARNRFLGESLSFCLYLYVENESGITQIYICTDHFFWLKIIKRSHSL